ncbi:MAG: tRNA (adenosine(37)-N6)-dimethylallyltransferase MiaA [Bacteroidales bacterium]|nr:tRNA (adenosine(37)-N6)-dimethylallyltransferase MiaA [Bacteroidales bacterium]
MEKKVFIVVGPTAVGKTRFAIELAQHLDTEIISADSRQFYKEMTIGTAVPSQEELDSVTHHFIQHMSIQDHYNVHKFEQDALAKIEEIFHKKDTVVVVGGSGLYLNALAYGIDDLPDPSEETRQKLKILYEDDGLEGLQSLLKKLDPVFLEQVDIYNSKRLIRALEVCITTGRPYSDQRLDTKKDRPFQIKWIGLKQERSLLNERINWRVDLMLDAGLIKEVRELYPFKELNALNTVGYREFFIWLDGKETYEWAVEKVKTNSRRFAKRQMTWFNKNEDILWIEVGHQSVIDWPKIGMPLK